MVYEILPQEYATSLRFCEKNLYRKYNVHWLKANPVQTVDPVMISIIVCRMHVKHLAVFNLIGNHLFHLCVRKLQCEYKIYPFLCERETWNAATREMQKMQVFVNRCLGKNLRVFWPRTISNDTLRRRTGQQTLSIEIRRRKWRWIIQALRRHTNAITKIAID